MQGYFSNWFCNFLPQSSNYGTSDLCSKLHKGEKNKLASLHHLVATEKVHTKVKLSVTRSGFLRGMKNQLDGQIINTVFGFETRLDLTGQFKIRLSYIYKSSILFMSSVKLT